MMSTQPERAAHLWQEGAEMTATREHWEAVYRERGAQDVSWYAPTLETSLRLTQQVAPPPASLNAY